MNFMKNNFRDFTNSDYLGFAGAMELPNGRNPKICDVETKDDVAVSVIISGDGAGSTIISLETEIGSYLLSLPGYNRCHIAIAESIVDYFEDYEVTSEAIEGIVSDYDMKGF